MIVLVDGFLRVLLLGKGIVCMCDVFWLGGGLDVVLCGED